jgi:hypothetical protein
MATEKRYALWLISALRLGYVNVVAVVEGSSASEFNVFPIMSYEGRSDSDEENEEDWISLTGANNCIYPIINRDHLATKRNRRQQHCLDGNVYTVSYRSCAIKVVKGNRVADRVPVASVK